MLVRSPTLVPFLYLVIIVTIPKYKDCNSVGECLYQYPHKSDLDILVWGIQYQYNQAHEGHDLDEIHEDQTQIPDPHKKQTKSVSIKTILERDKDYN